MTLRQDGHTHNRLQVLSIIYYMLARAP
jgi:hypothetical protein